ncbi:facilitated trehalose transporter Tret1-like [Battus philenor]|uniref:facilitated trehalose transporter Tret1-like n=1 Tax=Battus philenor TaxID=42288 RepID=UPI0035D0FF72
MLEKDIEKIPGHTRVQWMLALLANSTLILYGFEAGWMSPMTRVLQSDISPVGVVSDNNISLIASILCMTATISVTLYTNIADMYGRKPAMIIATLFIAGSWITKLSSSSSVGLVVARAFAGVGAGGSFSVVPMYVKEISQDDIRGLLGSLLIMTQNIGVLIMYLMGTYLDFYTILWIMCPLPIVTALLMIKASESPPFLVKKGNIEEAEKTVAFLRGQKVDSEVVQREIDVMKNQELYFQSLPKISLLSIFRNKKWRRIVVLMLMIMTAHGNNGAFAIINYGSSTLASCGVQYSISPELQSLSFPVVMIFGSLVSMGCVERFGRKLLLAGCLLLTSIAMGSLACAMLLQSHGVTTPSWLPVMAMMCTVFGYAAGVSPLPYIMMSEMLNFQIRAKVMGLMVTYAWFMTFIQLSLYKPIVGYFGQHAIFFFFFVVNLLGFLVTLIFLPETKGKSVEEIEASFKKK